MLVLNTCRAFRNGIGVQEQSKIRFKFFGNSVPIKNNTFSFYDEKVKKVVALKNQDGAMEPLKCFSAHSAIPQKITTLERRLLGLLGGVSQESDEVI